jgi:hypothetical protein
MGASFESMKVHGPSDLWKMMIRRSKERSAIVLSGRGAIVSRLVTRR